MIRVSSLSTTPVKGTALRSPTTIHLGPNGASENRSFYLIDDSGEMVNGKREGELVMVRSGYSPVDNRLTLRLPDGTVTSAEVPSDGEPVVTGFYGRPVAGRVLEGPWAGLLSDYVGRPVRLVAATRAGDAVDVHPVTLVSRESLHALREGAGAPGLDGRRFRMLIEVDGCAAFEEETWIGRAIQVGSASVHVEGPVPRCVVVTRDPDSGVVDLPVLRMLVAQRRTRHGAAFETPVDHLPDKDKVCFGVYGTVRRPGPVSVGDTVTASQPIPRPGAPAPGRP